MARVGEYVASIAIALVVGYGLRWLGVSRPQLLALAGIVLVGFAVAAVVALRRGR